MGTVRMDEPAPEIKQRFALNKKNAPYIFLLPTIILLSTFCLYPVFHSLWLSFHNLSGGKYIFTGFQNYSQLMGDRVFIRSLLNTLIILVFQVPVMLALSFLLALALNNRAIKGLGFWRSAYFMPIVTSLVACSIVFTILLNGDFGLVNYALNQLGLKPIPWLTTPFWAIISVMITVTWRWTGYNSIVFLAGLQNIPEELYEAAMIDGASPFRQFWHITLPLMKPILLFCVITSTNGTLHLFSEPFILTDGGPNDATLTMALYLYHSAFRYFKLGYASAISYVLVILIGGMALIQNKLIGGKNYENE